MVSLIWVAVGGTPGLLVLHGLQSLSVLASWLHSWDLVGRCMPCQDLGSSWLPEKPQLETLGAGPVPLLFPLRVPGGERTGPEVSFLAVIWGRWRQSGRGTGGRASGKACLPSPAPFVGQNNGPSWGLVPVCGLTGHRTTPACSRQPAP